MARPIRSSILAALALTAPVAAQRHQEHPQRDLVLNGEIALFDNLGGYSRSITTTNPQAQSYFDQGLRLAYAFGQHEARQSFMAATRADPGCASCWWGLAWALGPFANGGMDSRAGELAYEQIQTASRLAAHATEVERLLIAALAARYQPERARAQSDTAYMLAMRDVLRRFPNDPDVATMYAESIMVLGRGDYWTRAGQPQPGVDELLGVLESVLTRDPSHPGACHLYIHATEGSPAPERATRCADLLIGAMPGASHMQHMPSHIYVRTGRYADALRVSLLARAADLQAERGGAIAIYADHNLHMLLVAATYDGQSEVAIRTARDLAELAPSSAHHLPLVLARFGYWEEILRLREPRDRFQAAVLAYAWGLAMLRIGRPADARRNLALIDRELRRDRERREQMLLATARAILSAEIDADDGNHDAAVRTLEHARAIEADSIAYTEPEEWIVPVRQVLGAVLLDAGRPGEAESEYRGELETHPENGWSLYGLHLALTAQGKSEEAAEVLTRFQRAWARADVGLRRAHPRARPRRGRGRSHRSCRRPAADAATRGRSSSPGGTPTAAPHSRSGNAR
jgi:tetratricopeptide (TPR) repeat protein